MKLNGPPGLVHEFSAFRAFWGFGHAIPEARSWPLLNLVSGIRFMVLDDLILIIIKYITLYILILSNESMLSSHEIEDRLRGDLEGSQRRLSESLTLFLRIAGQTGADADRLLIQASASQSAARNHVIASMHRLNLFFLFGTVPAELKDESQNR